MGDLISRAAARNVINTWGRHENEDVRQAGHRIRRDMEAHVNKYGEKVHYARYTWEG